ncbi:MAG: SPFH domain-containing protein [Candidatus Hodarchaeales archaeon]
MYFKTIVVVPFNEVHVLSKGQTVKQYDGKGRYRYYKFVHGRTIIPKFVLDIEPPLIKLHDKDKLPFGVEISVKVQVTDPPMAAKNLTRIDHSTISKVVEDTVMSASRSIAMERSILEIMKEREDIENAIYQMVSDALNKLGLSPIIFDIKNIRDIEGSDVIANLERIKIAELRKDARIAEAKQNSEATIIEVETRKNSIVKAELMKQEEEHARLNRELMVAEENLAVEERRLQIKEQNDQRVAEIEKKKKLLIAEAEAEAIQLKARAEADSVRLKLEAEAEGIRMKGLAEAEAIHSKAEAMREYNDVSSQMRMIEVLAKAQVDAGAQIAKAIGQNNKIMYLPMNGDGMFSGLLPRMDALLQSDLVRDGIAEVVEGLQTATKGKKKGKNKFIEDKQKSK